MWLKVKKNIFDHFAQTYIIHCTDLHWCFYESRDGTKRGIGR